MQRYSDLVPIHGTMKDNRIKLVIFDLDGTLLDTMEDIANAANHALTVCGLPVRRLDEYNLFVGRGIANMLRSALPDGHKTDADVQRMMEIFVPYYNEHIHDCSRPYTGIEEMLDILAANGIKIAVASNKYQAGTESLVSNVLARHRFAAVLGQREGKALKPSPEIIEDVLEGVGDIGIDEVVYCGDSDVDMQTGINAGVKTIGVTWGFRTREELASYSPWFLADSPDEISEAVLGLNEIKA